MKLIQIINGYEALKKVSTLDLQSIAKNREMYFLMKKAQNEFDYFKSEQTKIIETFGKKQENGTFKFSEDNYLKYTKAISDIGGVEIEEIIKSRMPIEHGLLIGITASDLLNLEPFIKVIFEEDENA